MHFELQVSFFDKNVSGKSIFSSFTVTFPQPNKDGKVNEGMLCLCISSKTDVQ